MRIGELSRLTGVSVRALRYYEEQKLLAPGRTSGGYREYQIGDVAAVRGIRLLLAAGLGTATIANLMPCMDDGTFAPSCAGMLPDLARERERLTSAADELLAARDALDKLIATTDALPPADPQDCEALR